MTYEKFTKEKLVHLALGLQVTSNK